MLAYFPVLLCLFLAPTQTPIFVIKTVSPSRILPTNDLGRKKFTFTLFISVPFFYIGINSDSAGICSTTSLHGFRPLGKEIMKLIKFHTSFITPCFLPFANLSKSSVLQSTGKVHVGAQTQRESSGLLRNIAPLLTSLYLSVIIQCMKETAAKPSEGIPRCSVTKGPVEKALEGEPLGLDSLQGLPYPPLHSQGSSASCPHTVSFNASQINTFLLHINCTVVECHTLESLVNL